MNGAFCFSIGIDLEPHHRTGGPVPGQFVFEVHPDSGAGGFCSSGVLRSDTDINHRQCPVNTVR